MPQLVLTFFKFTKKWGFEKDLKLLGRGGGLRLSCGLVSSQLMPTASVPLGLKRGLPPEFCGCHTGVHLRGRSLSLAEAGNGPGLGEVQHGGGIGPLGGRPRERGERRFPRKALGHELPGRGVGEGVQTAGQRMKMRHYDGFENQLGATVVGNGDGETKSLNPVLG